MDSSNIEYGCIVYNREQSKENVRIIRRSEFHRYYPIEEVNDDTRMSTYYPSWIQYLFTAVPTNTNIFCSTHIIITYR
jgi:hypothetical protein